MKKQIDNYWGWLAIAIMVGFIALLLAGCSTTSRTYDDLLYEEELKNIAYKSVTKDDYIIKEDC